MKTILKRVILIGLGFFGVGMLPAFSQADMAKAKDGSGVFGYKDTPKLPWCDYVMHDPDRPIPPIVKPDPASPSVAPPSDAIVLFNGEGLSAWQASETWQVVDGEIVAGEGKLVSKDSFGDVQVHVEWLIPTGFSGPWYAHGNNGVTLMDQFEIQIFDSYDYKIPLFADGQCAAIYGQTPPMVNACLAAGEWQSFDILFKAPVFQGDSLVQLANLTLYHNGVLAHWNQPVYGETHHKQLPVYKQTNPNGPLSLPAHYCPVRFRNIWVRKLDQHQNLKN